MEATTMVAPSSSASTNNIMLAIYEKKTTSIDLYNPLHDYITITCSEGEAQNLDYDLVNLNKLRSDLEISLDSPPTLRRNSLVSYFKALSLVEGRFPISSDAGDVNITFTWHDSFKTKLKSSQANIHFEKAAVLFNIGAVFCQIGLSYGRNTLDGRKKAVHAFKTAASVFAYLRDNESATAMGSISIVDLSGECAGMVEKLMLAQAQECFLENTIVSGFSHGVRAKISEQVALYYKEVLASLSVAPLNGHFTKGWISHVQLKAALFHAEACYWYSLELRRKEEIGEEIARLRSGIIALTDAKKYSKGAHAQLVDASVILKADLNRNLERAVDENERVYLSRIPALAYLPPLPSVSMVEPKHMNGMLKQAEKLHERIELTQEGLREMGLPDSICALEAYFKLNSDLKDVVATFQTSGGLFGFTYGIQQLKGLIRENQGLVFRMKDASLETRFRTQCTTLNAESGTQAKKPQSRILTDNEKSRLKRYEFKLQQADKSCDLIKSCAEHLELLILDSCQIESGFPLPKSVMLMKRSLTQLEILVGHGLYLEDLLKEMRKKKQLEILVDQGVGFEDLLKGMKKKDDILPKLMTSSGSYCDPSPKEKPEYDRVCEEISQNIVAQEKLFLQIQLLHLIQYVLLSGSLRGSNPPAWKTPGPLVASDGSRCTTLCNLSR